MKKIKKKMDESREAIARDFTGAVIAGLVWFQNEFGLTLDEAKDAYCDMVDSVKVNAAGSYEIDIMVPAKPGVDLTPCSGTGPVGQC